MACLDNLFTVRSIGFDRMTWNKPRAWDPIRAEQLQDARHSNGAELSTGERSRGRLATIDPQGECIEIKGETNSTSHTNADTVVLPPLTREGEEAVPSFLVCIEKDRAMLIIA